MNIPFGYVINKERKLEIDPISALIVKEIFKIAYNVNGKEGTIKLKELESLTLFSNGVPKPLGTA